MVKQSHEGDAMIVPVVLDDKPVPEARQKEMKDLWQQHMKEVLEVIYALACPPGILEIKEKAEISVDDFFTAITQCGMISSSIYGPMIRRYLEGEFLVSPPSTLLPPGLPMTDETGRRIEGLRGEGTRRHRCFAAADSAMLFYDDDAPRSMKKEIGGKSPVYNPWEINFPAYMSKMVPGFKIFLQVGNYAGATLERML